MSGGTGVGVYEIRDRTDLGLFAEGLGFEPREPARGSTVFKTVAFVRSAIPPRATPRLERHGSPALGGLGLLLRFVYAVYPQ